MKNFDLFNDVLFDKYTAPLSDNLIQHFNELQNLLQQVESQAYPIGGVNARIDTLRKKIGLPQATQGLIQEKHDQMVTLVQICFFAILFTESLFT